MINTCHNQVPNPTPITNYQMGKGERKTAKTAHKDKKN